MKKLLVLLVAAGYCLASIAVEPTGSWILSNVGKMYMKKINVGVFKARIVLENGKKLTIPIAQLNSYSVNGKVFNKLPLYKNGKPTGQMVFMELIKTKGKLSLYRYGMTDDFVTPNLQIRTYNYFLYDEDKLHLALTDKTLPNVCKYFGLQMTYK